MSSLRRGHAHLLCIVPREIHELCVSSLHRDHHLSASNSSSRKQKKTKPEVAEVRAIPVQIVSIRSHGERSGNPYQPGSPRASPVSDPFKSRHPCKVLSMFLLDGDLIRCVLEGFIPFLRGCPHVASISRSAQADASLSVSRARGTVPSP